MAPGSSLYECTVSQADENIRRLRSVRRNKLASALGFLLGEEANKGMIPKDQDVNEVLAGICETGSVPGWAKPLVKDIVEKQDEVW